MNLTLLPQAHPAKVSGIFDQISNYLNLGLQGYAAYQQVTGAGGASGGGQAKGLAAIQAASAQILQALDQMVSAARQSAQQAATILPQAEQVAATLGNSQYFYQAKSGQDATVLRDAKTAAGQKVEMIRALASGGSPQTLITTNPTTGALTTTPAIITPSGTTPQQNQVTAQGLDNNLILYGAGAVALILLLRK